jgi:serine/threonine protein kinase
MSPEIVRKVYYEGFMADIWASGVVLYSMITGDFPFKGNNYLIYYNIFIIFIIY